MGVESSEATTKTMLSKYAETSRNVQNIEDVVGKLVEELGDGGFMGLDDIKQGMDVSIFIAEDTSQTLQYKTEVVEVDGIFIHPTPQIMQMMEAKGKRQKCEVRVIVDNAVYVWYDIEFIQLKNDKMNDYKLIIQSDPKVMNRRKYPRLPLKNRCQIMMNNGNTVEGRMVNICAGGYAFACKTQDFANAIGEMVELTISDLDFLSGVVLKGAVIRSTNDHGTYIVGCRMLEDNMAIKDYVKERIKE